MVRVLGLRFRVLGLRFGVWRFRVRVGLLGSPTTNF